MGKFASERDEAIYARTTETSWITSDSDEKFTLLVEFEDAVYAADDDDFDAWADATPTGFFIITEDGQGSVTVEPFDSEPELRAEFARRVRSASNPRSFLGPV
jgi:hypothetical protein